MNDNVFMEVIEYDSKSYKEYVIENLNEYDFSLLRDSSDITKWINIDGRSTEEILDKLSHVFHIHPLVTTNILDRNQRAKIEEYEDYIYLVTKMIYYSEDELIFEHISFILGKNYVISLGDIKGDVFDNIRSRLRSEGTQIRKLKSDFLLYSLLDAIVDGYFDVLEVLDDRIDSLEDEIIEGASQSHLYEIREMKRILRDISKSIWPLRGVASWISKEAMSLIRPSTELYIRDLCDHIMQIGDTIETYRDIVSGLTELYLSNTNNRLNEVMKLLTVISTIFIPLTFIVGVYGMNFKYMPEIQYRWGYGITWGVMIIITGLMVYYFKKKKWF